MIKTIINRNNFKMLSWLILPILGIYFFSLYWFKSEDPKEFIFDNQRRISFNELKIDKYLVEKPEFPNLDLANKGVVSFWFDDGWLSQYENAAPILEKAGISGVIAVVTNYPNYGGYANWNQLRDLQKRGWEITSHGVNHVCDENSKEEAIVTYEMKESKRVLFSEGLRNDHYVSPCGIESQDLINISKNYYKSYRTADHGINKLPLTNQFALKAISIDEEFTLDEINSLLKNTKTNKSWLILMFHQIENTEGKYNVRPETLTKIVEMVKRYELAVAVPSQVIKEK